MGHSSCKESDNCQQETDNSSLLPIEFEDAVNCYKQISMESFKDVNASWISYNTLCDNEKWDISRSQVHNLQEAHHLEVSSYSKCIEKYKDL